MAQKTAVYETTCPTCNKNFKAKTEAEKHEHGALDVEATCPYCSGNFRANIPEDCLEWDDQCRTEAGRFG